ncbi:hypothetical protein QBK99_17135 [Corticibacterium sp. UT-5YL-CI-8]|nr:hypothetical protein [Tianweitania sp. UT-5YL-CI-8]
MSEHGPTAGRGKWSQAGVPKKGWICENVEDLGDERITCEMCETMPIRFVHYMVNPRYRDRLGCGEVCAGHMEGDLEKAASRDKVMKSFASRRKKFPARKRWYINQSGNWQLKEKGFRVTMFKRNSTWHGVVARAGKSTFTREGFADLNSAQMAAFDTLNFLQDQEPERTVLVDPSQYDF